MEEQFKSITCTNCGAELIGVFCHDCGQKKMSTRISTKLLLTEVAKKLFDVDSGFWYTLKTLTVRPAQVVHDYLGGLQKRYAKPIQFFLVSSALVFFIMSLADGYTTGHQQFETGYDLTSKGDTMPPEIKVGLEKVGKLMKDPRIYFILSVPIFALVFGWSFRKQQLNYAEHIIFLLFTYATANFLSLPLLLLGSFYHIHFLTIATFFSMGYLIWTVKVFYQSSWLKAIVIYILATLFFMLIFTLFIGGALMAFAGLAR